MTEPLDLFETDAPDLETLRERAAACTACELHHDTTGTVFGSGPPQARLVMVGEQPGDQEDRKGAPITAERGEPRPWNDLTLLPTIHPSAILRADPARGQDRDEMFEGFVADLRRAGALLS